jgi:hypothetical protein
MGKINAFLWIFLTLLGLVVVDHQLILLGQAYLIDWRKDLGYLAGAFRLFSILMNSNL